MGLSSGMDERRKATLTNIERQTSQSFPHQVVGWVNTSNKSTDPLSLRDKNSLN